MSEIRFVERLGDAIEAATTERMKSRRRRVRNIFGGVLAVAVVGTSVATATSLLDGSEQLAAQVVYCYSTQSVDGGGIIIAPSATPPAQACAAELGTPGPRVACDAGDSVSVFPGRSTDICARHGFKPLPAEEAPPRRRVGRLARPRMPACSVGPQPARVVLAQRPPLEQQLVAVVEGEDREGPVQLSRAMDGELLADALLDIGLIDKDHVLDHRTGDSIDRCDDPGR